jgi:hypothetical protein
MIRAEHIGPSYHTGPPGAAGGIALFVLFCDPSRILDPLVDLVFVRYEHG